MPPSPEPLTRQMEVTWDLRSGHPELLQQVLAAAPGLADVLSRYENACPVAQTCKAFEAGAFYRPPGHARSFCLRLDEGGTVAIKGSEPCASDVVAHLRRAWSTRPLFQYSPLEHFVLAEQEPFLAMSSDAARASAELTATFVRDYAQHFGRLPKTPIPLRVYRLPAEVCSEFVRASSEFLSDRMQLSARKRTEELTANGLGVYVYFYPGVPLRAAHVLKSFPRAWEGQWRGASGSDTRAFDYDAAISGWIDLTCDILELGYLPTTKVNTGNCLYSQNVVIDGGLCDIDSVEPMRNINNRRDFVDAVLYSVQCLARTISEIVSEDEPTALLHCSWAAVWEEITSRLSKRVAAGARLEPRAHELFRQHGLDLMRSVTSALASDDGEG